MSTPFRSLVERQDIDVRGCVHNFAPSNRTSAAQTMAVTSFAYNQILLLRPSKSDTFSLRGAKMFLACFEDVHASGNETAKLYRAFRWRRRDIREN